MLRCDPYQYDFSNSKLRNEVMYTWGMQLAAFSIKDLTSLLIFEVN